MLELGKYVGMFLHKRTKNMENYYDCVYILKCNDIYYVGASKNLNKRIYGLSHSFISYMEYSGNIDIFVYAHNIPKEEIKDKETEAMKYLESKNIKLFNTQRTSNYISTEVKPLKEDRQKQTRITKTYSEHNTNKKYKSIEDCCKKFDVFEIFICMENSKVFIHNNAHIEDILYLKSNTTLIYSEKLDYVLNNVVNSFMDFDELVYNIREFITTEDCYPSSNTVFNRIKNYLVDGLELSEDIVEDYELTKFFYNVLYDDEYGVYLWLNSPYPSHSTSSNAYTGYLSK